MIVAVAVFVLGLGLTALGLLEPTMYDIGIMVVFLGGIGIGVRTLDLLRWLSR
jgi:hypothetical protein